MNKVYAVAISKYSGERVPQILPMYPDMDNKYKKLGYTFEEAKQHVLDWLEEKKEELSSMNEEDYFVKDR